MLKLLTGSILRGVVFALCLLGLLFYGILMIKNAIAPDFGWLLQSGYYMLAHHQLPTHDVFSWSWPDKPWVLYQWLFEVLVAWGHQVLGEQLLLRSFIVVSLLTYVLAPMLLMPRRVPTLLTLLMGVMGLIASSVTLTLRPMIVTSIFLLAQYLFLQRFREQQWSFAKTFRWLALIYLLWGNLHMGVTIGLGALVLMALGDVLERKGIYTYQPHAEDPPERPISRKQYLFLALGGIMASCINPYGIGIYTYLFDLSSQSFLNDWINELGSPDFHKLGFFPFLLAFLVFPFLLMRAKQVIRARDLLVLMAFNLTTLYIARFAVWTCLFASLILPKALYDWWCDDKHLKFIADFFSGGSNGYRFASIGLVLMGSLGLMALPQTTPQITQGDCEAFRPGIRAYQKLHLPTDRILNSDAVGSCMILYTPEQKVFFDTRFDFYAQDFSKQVSDTLVVKPGWEKMFQQWQINTVLLSKTCIMASKSCPLIHILEAEKGYTALYEDKAMVIMRKP